MSYKNLLNCYFVNRIICSFLLCCFGLSALIFTHETRMLFPNARHVSYAKSYPHTHIHTYNCDFNVNIVIILFWNCFYYVHNQLPNLLYIVFIILIYYTLCLYFPYSKRMNVFSILIFISGSLCNDDNLLNRLKKLVYAVFVNFDEWKINEC